MAGDAEAATLIQAVRAAGYDAAELRDDAAEAEHDAAEQAHYRRLIRNTVVAGALAAPLMLAELAGWLPALTSPGGRWFWIATGLLTLAAMVYSGGHFFGGAWRQFRHHNANMDTPDRPGHWRRLVVFDAGGPCFPTACPAWLNTPTSEAAVTIIALINLGSALESRARGKASTAIQRLLGLRPKTARLVMGDQERDVPIETLRIGDSIRVRPGEKSRWTATSFTATRPWTNRC